MVRKGLEEGITLRYAISIKMLRLGDYISYPLSKASCKISKELTGWARDQNFQTENLGWRLDEIDGKLVLVADDATRSTLILKGKIGCERGIEAIDTMQKALYTNKELAQAVVPMKEEMWKQLQECNQETTRRHYIDSQHNSTHEGGRGVRPVVFLKSGIILIDGDGSKEKPYVISKIEPSERTRIQDEEIAVIIKKCFEEGITLEDAISIKMLRLGDYISYPLSKASCKISKKLTGLETDQYFQTEKLGWKLDKINGNLVLVADNATKSGLTLKGVIGRKRGVEAIDTVQNALYINKAVAQAVVPMTKKMWEQLQKCNKKVTRPYWIGSIYDIIMRNFTLLGLRYAKSNYVSYTNLYCSGNVYSYCYGVRPVVFLKPDLMLEKLERDCGTKGNPWKISKLKSVS